MHGGEEMLRFSVGEYIRNIWYNIITIFILAVTFVVSIIFISNVNAQTRLYRLVDPYLDENSIIIDMRREFDLDALTKIDKVLMTNELFCNSKDMVKLNSCVVYSDDILNMLPPRISEGKGIDKIKTDENTIVALISDNLKGLGAGDSLTVEFYGRDGSVIPVNVLIAGVISNGQKIYMGSGEVNRNIGYEDLYCTYSYEQMGKPVLITTEGEIGKIGKRLSGENRSCIVKFKVDITEEEKKDNVIKVRQYEEASGISSVIFYPEGSVLCERKEDSMKSIMMKYIPLTVALFILIITCIMGIVFIKTATHIRYYTTLYICGMSYVRAVIITGVEMTVNCALAFILANTFLIIQNRYSLLGVINGETGILQVITIIGLSVILVLISMFVTRLVMKERSPMDILKDTAF